MTLDEDPGFSRIVIRDKKREEDQGPPALKTSTSGVVIDGTEHRNDTTSECSRSSLSRLTIIRISVTPPLSEENAGSTREGKSEPVETQRGTCRYRRVVRLPLTSASSGERPGGHHVQDPRRSHRCPKGARGRFRFSRRRPRSHLCCLYELSSSHMTHHCSNPPLTDQSAGSQEQDRRPPFTYGCTGGTFYDSSG